MCWRIMPFELSRREVASMKRKPRTRKPNREKTKLGLPDLGHVKSAVLPYRWFGLCARLAFFFFADFVLNATGCFGS
jgi:hypothetical protein